MYSGKQRTKILLETKVYQTLRNPDKNFDDIEIEEEFEEDVIPYTSWKWVLILYELAITVNVFHTILFWARWEEKMYDYYEKRSPHTHINVVIRILLMY